MANYLVTGAAGFIGARISEMLLGQGHTVTGVDNLNNAYDVRCGCGGDRHRPQRL